MMFISDQAPRSKLKTVRKSSDVFNQSTSQSISYKSRFFYSGVSSKNHC